MSTKIRLTRSGRKKIPYYTVVVTDSRSRRDGKFIEKIGTYNPLLKSDDENRFKINKERAEYWLGTGSQPSERVAILMIKAGIKAAEKFKPVFVPKQKKVVEKEVKAKEVPVEAPKEEASKRSKG
jgi:small subunit ribosomal protein S16